MLKVSIICSDPTHPVNTVLNNWIKINQSYYDLQLVEKASELRKQGDFLFLVSCSEFIEKKIRDRFTYALVLHASDLPHGRGWSPHVWEILSGAPYITLTMLEVADSIDCGNVWRKEKITLFGHELLEEINSQLFSTEIKLIEFALTQYNNVIPAPQTLTAEPSYYPKRNPEDSCIDINKSLKSQFNLLRACDNERFPAFFDRDGYRYTIKIEKLGKMKKERDE